MRGPRVLQWYAQQGGRHVVTGSNAHTAQDVGSHILQMEALARQLGLCPARLSIIVGRRERNMAYEHIFTPLQVGSLTLENRILLPPMVTFGLSGADGNVTQDVIRHYAARARGGAGLIVEATCVHPNGKPTEHQLGLWDDAQIEGHQMLTDAVHAFDRPVLVQLHHAGGARAVGDVRVSASAYEDHGRTARAMTERDVQACIQDFPCRGTAGAAGRV